MLSVLLLSSFTPSPSPTAAGVFREATECGFGPTKGSESPIRDGGQGQGRGPPLDNWSVPHTTGRGEGGERCRSSGDEYAEDSLPNRILFHSHNFF